MIVAFELQTYQGGSWRIDSLFDDRKLAVMEARRLGKDDRFRAVRVVEENYDPKTQGSTSKVIFRASRLQADREAALERQRRIRTEVAVADQAMHAAARGSLAQAFERQRIEEATSWLAILVFRGGAILLFGAGLFYGVGRLFGKF